jgi:hypothetical protein
MKFTFLLALASAIPFNLNLNWLRPPKFTPGEIKAFDQALKNKARKARKFKNPQITVYDIGLNDAGKSQLGLAVDSAVDGLGHTFKPKPGYVELIGLRGKHSHFLPIDRIEKEGLDIKRLKRLYGFAPRRLTVGEGTAIVAGASGLVAAGVIDSGIKQRRAKDDLATEIGTKVKKDSLAKSDRFQIAHGAKVT